MTFQTVGCPECDHLWLVEDLRTHDHAECPRCGHRRPTDRVRVIKEADEHAVAAEQRARILAARADEIEAFVEDVDDFGVLEDEIRAEMDAIHAGDDAIVEERLGMWDDEYADLADAYLDEQRVRQRETLREEAEQYLDRAHELDLDVAVGLEDPDWSDVDGGQLVATETVDVRADIHTSLTQRPADVVTEIVTSPEFEQALVDAVRDICSSATHAERARTLFEAGVTTADGAFARAFAQLDRLDETEGYQDALDLLARIGQDGQSQVGPLPIEAIHAPLALLSAAATTPTIAVTVGPDFQERDRETRERTLALLSSLGQACDVRVACSAGIAHWLRSEHRADLPATFSEQLRAHGVDRDSVDERVDAALDALDPDGRSVQVLRLLAAEPNETLAYGELASDLPVSRGRVSQLLTTLTDLDLVVKWGTRSNLHIDLLQAGSAVLDAFAAAQERQAALRDSFSESGQREQRPCNHAHGSGGEDRPDPTAPPAADRTAQPYRTRYLDAPAQHAMAGSADRGAVTAVRGRLPDTDDDDHVRHVGYRADRDEAYVAVEATTPLQWITSTALGLASPRFLEKALPTHRLENIDETPGILRDARCIGGLSSDAVDDPSILQQNLIEWGEQLASMTTGLQNEDHEDRDRFRGSIMRSAHGLAGTIVHLLDVVGVDLVQELRVPGKLSHENQQQLAQTVSLATAIQSHYAGHTIYRQVFERRQDKQEQARDVDVDAGDPLGTLSGGIVLRGPYAHQLARHVERQLTNPAPIREDAAEIAVRVPVRTVDRSDYAEVLSRTLSAKQLGLRSEVVDICRALTDPYAAATALHQLNPESLHREIRLDEVTYALSHVDDRRLLAELPPTVGKLVATLLQHDEPLSQADLADAAGVSARSVRRHIDELEAVDLARDTESGYRIALPFHNQDERDDEIAPAGVTSGTASRDLLYELTEVLVEDAKRFGDIEDPVGQAFIDWPPDYAPLFDEFQQLRRWDPILSSLCDEPEYDGVVVQFGAEIDQTALSDFGTEPEATLVTAREKAGDCCTR